MINDQNIKYEHDDEGQKISKYYARDTGAKCQIK